MSTGEEAAIHEETSSGRVIVNLVDEFPELLGQLKLETHRLLMLPEEATENSVLFSWGKLIYEEDLEDSTTLLDRVEDGRNVLSFDLVAPRFSSSDGEEPDTIATLCSADRFEEESRDLLLFDPPRYRETYEFTERALRVFGLSESDVDQRSIQCADSLVRLVTKCARENPGALVVFGRVPCVAESSNGRRYVLGESCLVDCLPSPCDEEAKRKARILGLMNLFRLRMESAFEDPLGNELACTTLAASFHSARAQHLNCKTCCPTAASRRKAKRELVDKETCTLMVGSNSSTCGSWAREKLIYVTAFFPDCLSERWQQDDSYQWLCDKEKRLECIKESVPGTGYDFRPCPIDVRFVDGTIGGAQDRYSLIDCLKSRELEDISAVDLENSPGFKWIGEEMHGLAQDEWWLGLHWGIKGELGRLDRSTHKFRKPGVKVIYEGSSFQMKVDRKKCSNCGEEEALTRTFSFCSRCKEVFYCSAECQGNDWKRGHKAECRPAPSKKK